MDCYTTIQWCEAIMSNDSAVSKVCDSMCDYIRDGLQARQKMREAGMLPVQPIPDCYLNEQVPFFVHPRVYEDLKQWSDSETLVSPAVEVVEKYVTLHPPESD